MTVTLYEFIQSELINEGFNEFFDEQGNLVYFDEEAQFMSKILSFDEDVAPILDKLFTGVSLKQRENDLHFKKAFLYRFINRNINRQTIESFRLELLTTFLSNESFINRIYEDMEKYVTQTSENKQTNNQLNDGTTTADNRQAYADLPQNNVQIDVNDTVMDSASDNTISRNKQTNQQQTEGQTTGETKSYSLDELFKTNGLLEQILNIFDVKCFMQVW